MIQIFIDEQMKGMFWVKSLVAVIYVALGSWLIINPTKFAGMDFEPLMGRCIGLAILAYGLFRLYTHYMEYSNSKRDE